MHLEDDEVVILLKCGGCKHFQEMNYEKTMFYCDIKHEILFLEDDIFQLYIGTKCENKEEI